MIRCDNVIQRGYLGSCEIDGVFVRVSSFEINLNQNVEFYDHTIGLNDYVKYSPNFGIKGEHGQDENEISPISPQKKFWRPGVKTITGGINFIPNLKILNKVFNLAKYGKKFDILYRYSQQSILRKFVNCRINTMQFTVISGEDINVSLNIMAENVEEYVSEDYLFYREAAKIINFSGVNIDTIHKYEVNGITKNLEIQSFNFTINNSCKPIYTAGMYNTEDPSFSLLPRDIRNGMQDVSGSISYYLLGFKTGDEYSYPFLKNTILYEDTYPSKIYIDIEDDCGDYSFNEEICVLYKPVNLNGSVGPVIQTLLFNGVGYALGKPY